MASIFAELDHIEIRSPRCLHSALDSVILFERGGGSLTTSAEVTQQLLHTGVFVFGWLHPVNRRCVLHLAKLWQVLGKLNGALALNYLTLVQELQTVNVETLELRIRMAELVYELNRSDYSDLIRQLCLVSLQILLSDVLNELDQDHTLVLRVKQTMILLQSGNNQFKCNNEEDQHLLEVHREECAPFLNEKENNLDNMDFTHMENTKMIDAVETSAVNQTLNDCETVGESNSTQQENDRDAFLRKSLTAAALLAQGKPHLTAQLYQELLFYTSATFGPTDQTTLCTKQTLAAVLNQQGRYQEALQNYEESLTTAKEALGNDHRVTRIALKQMDAVRRNLDRLNDTYLYYTQERKYSNWFNRFFASVLAGIILWVMVGACLEHCTE